MAEARYTIHEWIDIHNAELNRVLGAMNDRILVLEGKADALASGLRNVQVLFAGSELIPREVWNLVMADSADALDGILRNVGEIDHGTRRRYGAMAETLRSMVIEPGGAVPFRPTIIPGGKDG